MGARVFPLGQIRACCSQWPSAKWQLSLQWLLQVCCIDMRDATCNPAHPTLPAAKSIWGIQCGIHHGKRCEFCSTLRRERWEEKAELQRVAFSNLVPCVCELASPVPASLAQKSLPQSLETGRQARGTAGPDDGNTWEMRGRPTTAAVVAVSRLSSWASAADPAPADEAPMEAEERTRRREMRRDRRSRCSRRNTAKGSTVSGLSCVGGETVQAPD